jgi:hypothetical protein
MDASCRRPCKSESSVIFVCPKLSLSFVSEFRLIISSGVCGLCDLVRAYLEVRA